MTVRKKTRNTRVQPSRKAGKLAAKPAIAGSSPVATKRRMGTRNQPAVEIVVPLAAGLPLGYAELLEGIKSRIQRAQIRGVVAANRELIQMYWDIGGEIVRRQDQEGWGAKVIDRLSVDLQNAFPGRAGFSRTNIHRARAFFIAYAKGTAI